MSQLWECPEALTVLQSIFPITGPLCGPDPDHSRGRAYQRDS